MQQVIFDYIILELDQIYDVRDEGGLITLNDAWIAPNESQRYIHQRLWGRVVSLPRGYTDLKFDPIDPGVPNHRIYVGHDIIQERVNEGYKWARDTHYHPGITESFDFKTIEDVSRYISVRLNDKVYGHPATISEENALWKKDNKYYFRVRIDEILCAVRDGELISQGQHVLLKPHMETEEELMQGGLQIKPHAQAKPQQGFVVCAREEFCAKGVLVFFIADADWLVTIEGQPMYCMKEEDLFCWLEQ